MGFVMSNRSTTKTATKTATKTVETVHVPAFGIDIPNEFAPIANAIRANAHGAFAILLITSHMDGKPVTMADLIQWQCNINPEKYRNPDDENTKKRARGNIAAHIANFNAKSKTVNLGLCGLRVIKTVDGFRIKSVE